MKIKTWQQIFKSKSNDKKIKMFIQLLNVYKLACIVFNLEKD